MSYYAMSLKNLSSRREKMFNCRYSENQVLSEMFENCLKYRLQEVSDSSTNPGQVPRTVQIELRDDLVDRCPLFLSQICI